MKKRLLSALTALLCVSSAIVSVPASARVNVSKEYFGIWKEVDGELVRMWENFEGETAARWIDGTMETYIAPNQYFSSDQHVEWRNGLAYSEPWYDYYAVAIVTDGTVPPEILEDGNSCSPIETGVHPNIIPTQIVYDGNFDNMVYDSNSDDDVHDLENIYITSWKRVTPDNAKDKLNSLLEQYDYIEEAYLVKYGYYGEMCGGADYMKVIAPSGMELSLETIPEVAFLGEESFFQKIADDGERAGWLFFGNTDNNRELVNYELGLLGEPAFYGEWMGNHPTESFVLMKNLEQEIAEAHPEVMFVPQYGYANETLLINLTERTTREEISDLVPVEAVPAQISDTESITGDVNGDNVVDILDVITINKAVLGKELLTDAQNAAADVNKDNKVDATDSLAILKYTIGLIETFDTQ